MLKKQFLAGLFLFAGLCAGVWGQSAEQANLINRAGEQRMLSQRIAKSFIQLGLNLQSMAAKQELDAAISRFESNLDVLSKAPPGILSPTSLQQLKDAWPKFKSVARGVPKMENAVWLSHQADEVMAAAETHVRNLQNSAPGTTGRWVAQAGRQRMLSQRIAKAYLLISWGDRSETTREELDVAVNEFSGSLKILRQRGENTPALKVELDEMAQQWEWLQSALAAEGASTYRLIVSEAAEAILISADRVTKMYEAQSR